MSMKVFYHVHKPNLIHTMYLAELCETQQRCNDDYGNAFFCVLKDGRRNAHDNQIISADFLVIIKNWFIYTVRFWFFTLRFYKWKY